MPDYDAPPVLTSNKRSFEAIDLTCDPIYEEDTALFTMICQEMENNLASLNILVSIAAETPLEPCFNSEDSCSQVPFDDSTSISILDNNRTPTIADINQLFD